MPLIRCATCSKTLQLADKHVGMRVRCPNCKTIFEVRKSHLLKPPIEESQITEDELFPQEEGSFNDTSGEADDGSDWGSEESDEQVWGDAYEVYAYQADTYRDDPYSNNISHSHSVNALTAADSKSHNPVRHKSRIIRSIGVTKADAEEEGHVASWGEFLLGKWGVVILIIGAIAIAPNSLLDAHNWLKDNPPTESSAELVGRAFRRSRRHGMVTFILFYSISFLRYVLPCLVVSFIVRLPHVSRMLFEDAGPDRKRFVKLQSNVCLAFLLLVGTAIYITMYWGRSPGSFWEAALFNGFCLSPVFLGLQLIVVALMPVRHMRKSVFGRAIWTLTQVTEVEQARKQCWLLGPSFILITLPVWAALMNAMIND